MPGPYDLLSPDEGEACLAPTICYRPSDSR